MKTDKILLCIILLALGACGKNSGTSEVNDKDSTQTISKEVVEAAPGTYYAVLRPVNFRANGFFPYGTATFTVAGDQVQVSTSMDDDQAVIHRQTLHMGSRCPTVAEDDANGDGFVDFDEAQRVVGQALMPLDGDLNSQSAGEGTYPRGPAMTYQKFASLTKVNADLVNQRIGFEGRVVLIHGTTPWSLPSSLASYNGEPAHLSLPVVCGVLRKVQ